MGAPNRFELSRWKRGVVISAIAVGAAGSLYLAYADLHTQSSVSRSFYFADMSARPLPLPRPMPYFKRPEASTYALSELAVASIWLPASAFTSGDSENKASTQSAAAVVHISRYLVPAPLRLTLPSQGGTVASTSSDAASAQLDTRLPLFSAPDISSPQRLSEEQKLFNNDTGMRGFMAQNWFNKNMAVQGGFAIPGDHLRDDQESLGDQMAVGMGFLLNF